MSRRVVLKRSADYVSQCATYPTRALLQGRNEIEGLAK